MTMVIPQCAHCIRAYDDDSLLCTAFPEEGIPDEIIQGRFDHRRRHPRDNGLTFEQDPNAPDYSKIVPFEGK